MLFDMSNVELFLDQLRAEIDAPFVSGYKSTLGGEHRVSVMLTVSLDPKSDWTNGILENSRYVKMHLYNDGTMEQITGPRVPRFRKSKARSFEDAVRRINKFLVEWDTGTGGKKRR